MHHGPNPYTTAGSPPVPPYAPRMIPVPLPENHTGPGGLATPAGSSSFPTGPSLHYILSYDPLGRLDFHLYYPITHAQLRPGYSRALLQEYATSPPVTRLHIGIAGFPLWTFDVTSVQGVTVTDVLIKVHECLSRPVNRSEFHSHNSTVRQIATLGFQQRQHRAQVRQGEGMIRLDFLGPRVKFIGLTIAADGSGRWDVQTSASIAF